MALRLGLHLRDFRVRRRLPPPRSRVRHLRTAQPAALVLAAGFLLGPISSVCLRGWTPGLRLHGWAGLAALACFAGAAILGLRLKRGRSPRAALHGVLGVLGLLAGLLAGVSGIELLP